MGLVETGVGLLPAGGGSKEMLLRRIERAAAVRDSRGDSVELMGALRRAFETIAMAKVSTSAEEARHIGILLPADGITMNRERLLMDAQRQAGELAAAGYVPPRCRARYSRAGRERAGHAETRRSTHDAQGEYISDHDVKVANHLAYVCLCGGPVTPGTLVSEQYLLDLEREAFLSLCGEKKTQERIAFTLKTGKPLRN
jgi:3-hydroxyacyl-CoA dehydrogenase